MAATRRKTSSTSQLRDGAHERVDAVADSIDAVRERANEFVEQGRERATELVEGVEARIQQRPATAILVAAAVGFVLGCFLSRR